MPQGFLSKIFSVCIVFSSILLANVEEYKLPVPPEPAQSWQFSKYWAELRKDQTLRARGRQVREESAK